MALTPKQERFIEEYLIDLNATDAARRAGYSPKTAEVIGYENLRKPQIAAAIAERQAKLAEKTEITQERIVTELAKLGFANMMDYIRLNGDGTAYIDLSKMTRDQAAAIGELTIDEYTDKMTDEGVPVKKIKFKLADKRGALVDLAKILGLVVDKSEVKHSGEVTITVGDSETAESVRVATNWPRNE